MNKKFNSLSLVLTAVVAIFFSIPSESVGMEAGAVKSWFSEDRNIMRLYESWDPKAENADQLAKINNLIYYIDKPITQGIPYRERTEAEGHKKSIIGALEGYRDNYLGPSSFEPILGSILSEAIFGMPSSVQTIRGGVVRMELRQYIIMKINIYQQLNGQQHPYRNEFKDSLIINRTLIEQAADWITK